MGYIWGIAWMKAPRRFFKLLLESHDALVRRRSLRGLGNEILGVVEILQWWDGHLQLFLCLKYNWLVVWIPLKHIGQLKGSLFPICGKIKNVPNHQPASNCLGKWIALYYVILLFYHIIVFVKYDISLTLNLRPLIFPFPAHAPEIFGQFG